MKAVLEVDIKKRIGDFQLDVSFAAETGEVFALLGGSGSGKSMTLRCIAGIERPDTGRIALNGRVLFDSAAGINLPPQARRVGYMFQDYALFPTMTVLKNVLAGMGRRPDIRTAEEILARFQLTELADRRPDQLSGGQKQRTAMARIMASKPDAVLLDEPFSALDTHLRWQMEGEMERTLLGMNLPCVFVSHSRDEVFRLCRRVCCLSGGRSGASMTVKDFFSNPGTREAALLSGCKNLSEIRKTGSCTLEALAWGQVFRLRREIPDDTRYVGIRAHYLSAERKPGCDNELIPEEVSVTENPFEWSYFLKMKRDAAPVEWRTAKLPGEEPSPPERLYLNSDDLMLLT